MRSMARFTTSSGGAGSDRNGASCKARCTTVPRASAVDHPGKPAASLGFEAAFAPVDAGQRPLVDPERVADEFEPLGHVVSGVA